VNCRHVRVLLSAYLDSELTGYEMLAIREHLTQCQTCSEERDSIEFVKAMVRSLPQRDPRPEWLGALQQQAFFASLPFGARLRLMFAQDSAIASLRGRRMASAAMLSVLGVFMAAGTFENIPRTNGGSAVFVSVQRRPVLETSSSNIPVAPLTANQEIQFLDPRQHPADLTGRESSLTLFNVLEPQSRYNNITLTSFTSLGNQLISSR
jgi:anti-sigma factor RsiW